MDRSAIAAPAKAAHTPGPWSVEDPLGPDIISIVANGGAEVYDWKHVAQLSGRPDDKDDIPAREAKANAHLIAAAPDLYDEAKNAAEALAQAALHLEEMHLDLYAQECRRHAASLQTALAKAEGR